MADYYELLGVARDGDAPTRSSGRTAAGPRAAPRRQPRRRRGRRARSRRSPGPTRCCRDPEQRAALRPLRRGRRRRRRRPRRRTCSRAAGSATSSTPSSAGRTRSAAARPGAGRPARRAARTSRSSPTSTFEQAVFGATVPVTLRSCRSAATTATARGAGAGTQPVTCSECGGAGQVRRVRQTLLGQMVTSGPCPRCGGLGQVVVTPCPTAAARAGSPRSAPTRSTCPPASTTARRCGSPGVARPVRGAARPATSTCTCGSASTTASGATATTSSPTCRSRSPRPRSAPRVTLPTLDGDEELRRSPAGTQTGRVFPLRGRGVPHAAGPRSRRPAGPARGRGADRARRRRGGAAAPARRQARRGRRPAGQGPVLADQVRVLVGRGRWTRPLRRSAAHVLVADVAAPVARRRRPPPPRAGAAPARRRGRHGHRRGRSVAGVPTVERRRSRSTVPSSTVAAAGRAGDDRRRPAQGRPPGVARPEVHRGRRRPDRAAVGRALRRALGRRAGGPQLGRLRRIAVEASMQSRRVWLPELAGPVPAVRRAWPWAVVAEPGGRAARTATIAVVAIGPEGGWSPAEVALAGGRSSLGPNVLRVETAAVVAASLMVGVADGGPVSEEPFGVYVHVPFCATRCDYCAFATWTDRPHLIGDYLAALRDRDRAGPSMPGWPRPPACSSAAARRRWCRRRAWPRCSGPIPLAPGAEVTVECNPDDVTDGAVRDVRRRRREPRLDRRAVDGARTCCAALGRTHDPANVVARRRRGPRRRAADVQPRPHLRRGGRDARRLARDARARARARAAARVGLRADRRGRHAAGRRPGPPPRRRRPGRRVRAGRRPADARPGWPTTRSRTGPGPGHECRHNLLYWRRATTVGIGCAAHSHRAGRRWWNLRTPERYIAAVARRPLDRGRRRDARRRDAGASRACSCRCAPGRGAARRASTATSCPALVERAGDRWVLTRRGRLLANEVAVRLRCEPRLDGRPIGRRGRSRRPTISASGSTRQWPAPSITSSVASGRWAANQWPNDGGAEWSRLPYQRCTGHTTSVSSMSGGVTCSAMSWVRPPRPWATASTTPAAMASTAPGTASSSARRTASAPSSTYSRARSRSHGSRRDQRRQQLGDAGRAQLDGELGDGTRRSSLARSRIARLGVGGDRRQAGRRSPTRVDERRVAGGDGEARAATPPTSRASAHDRIPRWPASAATSSANEPTVPVRVRRAAAGTRAVDGDQPDAGHGGRRRRRGAGPGGSPACRGRTAPTGPCGIADVVEAQPPAVGERRTSRRARREATGRGRQPLSAGSLCRPRGRVAQLVRAPP